MALIYDHDISSFKTEYSELQNITKIDLLNHNINTKIFLISTKNKKFVLKYFLDNSSYEKINRMCKILNACSNKVKIEKPVKNKNKNFVNFKKKYYLTEYLEGNAPKGTKGELDELSFNLAKLHQSFEQIAIPYNFQTNFHLYSIISVSELNKIHSIINKKNNLDSFDKKIIKNFKFLGDNIIYDSEISQKSKILKQRKQLIHDDLHPKNLIFKNSHFIAFIDFSTLKKGYVIEDVAFCALRFATIKYSKINKINFLIKLFIKKYLKHNLIPSVHLEYLNFFQSHKLLRGLSFIIKNHYYKNSHLWDSDFDKYNGLLKMVKSEELAVD